MKRNRAQILSSALSDDGVAIYLNSTVKKVSVNGLKKTIDIMTNDTLSTITVSDILVSIGQVANTSDLGLEAANVGITDKGRVIVDASLCTSNSRIYAIGNICVEQEFVLIPDALARIATNNALSNQHEKIDMTAVPWCIYTDPEIAHIGLQVRQARG